MITKSFKMHDILQIEDGSLVMVKTVTVSGCSDNIFIYDVITLTGNVGKAGWLSHHELCYIGNPVSDFLKIQERLNE